MTINWRYNLGLISKQKNGQTYQVDEFDKVLTLHTRTYQILSSYHLTVV
jgi:hypothetical protein